MATAHLWLLSGGKTADKIWPSAVWKYLAEQAPVAADRVNKHIAWEADVAAKRRKENEPRAATEAAARAAEAAAAAAAAAAVAMVGADAAVAVNFAPAKADASPEAPAPAAIVNPPPPLPLRPSEPELEIDQAQAQAVVEYYADKIHGDWKFLHPLWIWVYVTMLLLAVPAGLVSLSLWRVRQAFGALERGAWRAEGVRRLMQAAVAVTWASLVAWPAQSWLLDAMQKGAGLAYWAGVGTSIEVIAILLMLGLWGYLALDVFLRRQAKRRASLAEENAQLKAQASALAEENAKFI